MRSLPAAFSRPLIPKLLDDSKTNTRRLLNPQPKQISDRHWEWRDGIFALTTYPDRSAILTHCPYGQAGDRLWVREDHRFLAREGNRVLVRYEAEGSERWATLTGEEAEKLSARSSPLTRPQPGRFLYRSCARIELDVLHVRVERLQEISEEDAKAEGVEGLTVQTGPETLVGCPWATEFRGLWDSINGDRANWASNPWVWAISFRRVQP